MYIQFKITSEQAGKRFDAVLAGQYPQFSRSLAARLISAGSIRISGSKKKPGYKVNCSDMVAGEINLPETAILAVGAIIDKPVALEGEVVIRPMMTITLSYDHRIIDGAEAGKFMQTLKAFMEDPIKIFA